MKRKVSKAFIEVRDALIEGIADMKAGKPLVRHEVKVAVTVDKNGKEHRKIISSREIKPH